MSLFRFVCFSRFHKRALYKQENQVATVAAASQQTQPPLTQSNHHLNHHSHPQHHHSRSNATMSTTNNNNLNEYYESLRNNVITLLEHVRIPGSNSGGGSGGGVGGGVSGSSSGIISGHHMDPKMGHEHFDSYLSKLQSLCSQDGYCTDENRPMYETVKSALQDFTVLPTAI